MTHSIAPAPAAIAPRRSSAEICTVDTTHRAEVVARTRLSSSSSATSALVPSARCAYITMRVRASRSPLRRRARVCSCVATTRCRTPTPPAAAWLRVASGGPVYAQVHLIASTSHVGFHRICGRHRHPRALSGHHPLSCVILRSSCAVRSASRYRSSATPIIPYQCPTPSHPLRIVCTSTTLQAPRRALF